MSDPIKKRGAGRPSKQPEDMSEILALIRDGKSHREISTGLGVSLGKCLVDDAPALAVDAIPNNFSALSGFGQHVPVHAHALHGCSCSPIDRHGIFTGAPMPYGSSTFPA